MYFQILRSGEHFAARWKRTGEWFFAGVHANVIDQFVFGLKWSAIARTAHPEAGVRCAFGPANMLHRQMGDNFMHRIERFAATLSAAIIVVIVVVQMMMMMVQMMMVADVLVDPHTGHLLFDRRLMAHVAEEGAGRPRLHGQIQIVRMRMHGRREIGLMRRCMRMVWIVVGRWWWRRRDPHAHRMLVIGRELLIVHHRWMRVRMGMRQRGE